MKKVIKSSLFFLRKCANFLEINQIYSCTGPTSDGSAAAIIVSEDFVKSRGLEDRVKLFSIPILRFIQFRSFIKLPYSREF